MKCTCYKKAFLPVIELMETADGLLYFRTPDEEIIRQKIHDIVLIMNTKFRCIDRCWDKYPHGGEEE